MEMEWGGMRTALLTIADPILSFLASQDISRAPVRPASTPCPMGEGGVRGSGNPHINASLRSVVSRSRFHCGRAGGSSALGQHTARRDLTCSAFGPLPAPAPAPAPPLHPFISSLASRACMAISAARRSPKERGFSFLSSRISTSYLRAFSWFDFGNEKQQPPPPGVISPATNATGSTRRESKVCKSYLSSAGTET